MLYSDIGPNIDALNEKYLLTDAVRNFVDHNIPILLCDIHVLVLLTLLYGKIIRSSQVYIHRNIMQQQADR